jgi:hypothetical protein
MGYILDMRSAYWQVASKAPSLLCRVDYDKERIIWHIMSHQQQERWERCKVALEPHKRLRLAIIGVNSTGLASVDSCGVRYYAGGERKALPGTAPTCFRNLAILTVRCAYELTQMQLTEAKAWYANADCVLLEQPECAYWNSIGIEYRCKAHGPVEVYGLGQWKVGEEETIPYKWKKSLEQQGYTPCINPVKTAFAFERPVYHEQLYSSSSA